MSASSDLPVRVIVPHSGLDGFRFAVQSLGGNFRQARELAWRFFLRDTRASHRQSLLGYFWVVLPPLVNTLVWVLLNKSDVVKIDSGGVPYPVFVLAGTVLWAAFNGAVIATLGVVNDARGMLAKVNFPHEALVYTAFLKTLVDSLIPAVLLIPALFWYRIPWHAEVLLFPVALLAALFLGMALALLLVPVASLYSDIGRGVQLGLRFGFFVTPVIFPLPAAGLARTLMLANPVSPIIATGRAWLTGSGVDAMPVAVFALLGASIVLTAAGLIILKVTLPHLIERLSA